IRYLTVTGVQTCALPIFAVGCEPGTPDCARQEGNLSGRRGGAPMQLHPGDDRPDDGGDSYRGKGDVAPSPSAALRGAGRNGIQRSEERRVGKESMYGERR